MPDHASVAVLPFDDDGGGPDRQYFADGLIEEIIGALSRIGSLLVIARNSTFFYRGQAVDPIRLRTELGVGHVLTGRLHKAGERLQVLARLFDTAGGALIWEEEVAGPIGELFAIRDRLVRHVAGSIAPHAPPELASPVDPPTRDMVAFDLYLRSISLLFSFPKNASEAALELLQEATRRDPVFAHAIAAAALCHMHLALGGAPRSEANRAAAIDCARRALNLAKDDPDILVNAALVLACFGEDLAAMNTLVGRALAQSPSCARAWYVGANLNLWSGDAGAVIEKIERASRLSPRAPLGPYPAMLGFAYFMQRRFVEAAAEFAAAIEQAPGSPHPYRCLAACFAHMGRLSEAQELVEQLRTLTPDVIPKNFPVRHPEHRELFFSGLRLAMSGSD